MIERETSAGRAPRARVVRHIEDWIRDGDLASGEPLPAERILAERLAVSRNTVRSALTMLESEGVIASNGGRLRIVAGAQSGARGDWLAQSIALITYSPEELPSESEPGWALQLTRGAMRAISEKQLHALALHPFALSEQTITQIGAQPLRGVILTEVSFQHLGNAAIARMQSGGARVVAYGDAPAVTNLDRVTSDHEMGCRQLAQWLIARGRKRLSLVWPDPADGYWLPFRQAGYERALRENGSEPRPVIGVPGVDFTKQFQQSAQSHDEFMRLARHFAGYLAEHLTGPNAADALLLWADEAVSVVTAACRLLGRTPGEDILIAGYDNLWQADAGRQYEPQPPAVTADKRYFEIGQELVSLLLQRANGELPDAPVRRLVEPRLVAI